MEAKQDGEVAKTYNARLRARLAEFKDAEGLKLGALARQIGTNEAAVSRYLDGHPLGDVAKLEARVLDFLEAFARRRSWDELCFDTEAVAMCEGAFDLIRESGDIGLVHGPAGIGKSTTCRRYARTHSTAIFFTVMQGAGQDYNIVRAICAALPTPRSAEDKRLKRAEWIFKKLSGSRRLVIIDNAQRIGIAGLRWLMDFNDATGCPVALVGNPEVLEKVKVNDQMSSRIGYKQSLADAMKIDGPWLDAAADAMVAAMWPEAAAELRTPARDAARSKGYLRTLNKQLRIALRLAEKPRFAGRYGLAFATARPLIGADEE